MDGAAEGRREFGDGAGREPSGEGRAESALPRDSSNQSAPSHDVSVEPAAAAMPVEPLRDEAPAEPRAPMQSRTPSAPFAPLADVLPSGSAPQPVSVASQADDFVLPLDTLEAVAEAAGLQWVNSDVEKIRAVREAMANETPPVRIPRERQPVAAVDEGPLVLVETRKDLSQFKLPFETAAQQPQERA
ncbi:MAG: hypothetical protein ABI809_04625 [Caldimonas sp.]